MQKNDTAGLSLVELIIVVFIAGILAITIGILMVRSFDFWKRAADRITMESDARYFRRKLEYQFRSATTNPVTILQTSVSSDTLRFATYFRDYNASNQYTQNEYTLVSGNLVRRYWNATVNPTSGAMISTAFGGAPDGVETIVPATVQSLAFGWAGKEPTTSSAAIAVTMTQYKQTASGDMYLTTSSFVVGGRNR